MVELLLGAGASRDVRDGDGKTPRDVAKGAAVDLLLAKHVTE